MAKTKNNGLVAVVAVGLLVAAGLMAYVFFIAPSDKSNDGVSEGMISSGVYHSVAIKGDGSLWAWGYNASGQLGLGDYVNRSVPVRVDASTDWVMVSAGGTNTFAIKADGTLWAWGMNNYGQLGLGDKTSRVVPVQVGSSSDWVSVSSGGNYTFAIKANGTLWSCGQNNYGQLGLGDTVDRDVLTQIGSSAMWAAVSAGDANSASAIKTDGTLWVWGLNLYGQLGLGDAVDRDVPVQIDSSTDWASASTGSYFTFAIKANGTLWAWGMNNLGQLGIGTVSDSDVPVRVTTSGGWVSVAVGSSHSLAIKNDGTLWAWGNNGAGQLGVGDLVTRYVPMKVDASSNWAAVSAGVHGSLALKTDGTLWSWGYNQNGQLGLGDTVNRDMPVNVGGTGWLSSGSIAAAGDDAALGALSPSDFGIFTVPEGIDLSEYDAVYLRMHFVYDWITEDVGSSSDIVEVVYDDGVSLDLDIDIYGYNMWYVSGTGMSVGTYAVSVDTLGTKYLYVYEFIDGLPAFFPRYMVSGDTVTLDYTDLWTTLIGWGLYWSDAPWITLISKGFSLTAPVVTEPTDYHIILEDYSNMNTKHYTITVVPDVSYLDPIVPFLVDPAAGGGNDDTEDELSILDFIIEYWAVIVALLLVGVGALWAFGRR